MRRTNVGSREANCSTNLTITFSASVARTDNSPFRGLDSVGIVLVRRQNIWRRSRRRLAESGAHLGLMLGGELAVPQAPMFDGLSLDPLALFDDGLRPAEVGVGGRLVGLDTFRQFARDVAGTVVAEQPGLVQHRGAVAAGGRQDEVQRVGHVLGAQVGAQLPGDDVAREVVEHGRQVAQATPLLGEGAKAEPPHPMILQ